MKDLVGLTSMGGGEPQEGGYRFQERGELEPTQRLGIKASSLLDGEAVGSLLSLKLGPQHADLQSCNGSLFAGKREGYARGHPAFL